MLLSFVKLVCSIEYVKLENILVLIVVDLAGSEETLLLIKWILIG